MKLRDYQNKIKLDIERAWNSGAQNVLAQLPTGAGKTVVFSALLKEHEGFSCVIAHRSELVSQISLSLARNGVRHKIIAPGSLIKQIVTLHVEELGLSYYANHAQCAVISVDTITRRLNDLLPWLRSVTLWVQDEAHHLLRSNKWGKVVAAFSTGRGLGVTATPRRADGRGLGRQADGVFDVMVQGVDARKLIDQGYLSEYRVYAPPPSIDLGGLAVSKSTGDYSPPGLRVAVSRSKIVGDVVEHYLKIAPGKTGVTFSTDVENSKLICQAFNDAGVPAATVCAKTPLRERLDAVTKLKNKELLQLVNVDIFGEGFDLPAIEVVSFARPTQSIALFLQQFGRSLRVAPGKKHAIIIDHVGNVLRHGLPDTARTWDLQRTCKKAGDSETIGIKSCPRCTCVYEKFKNICPECGFKAEPQSRATPEQVDGDLLELSPESLEKLRAAVHNVDRSPEAYQHELAQKGAPLVGQWAGAKRHKKKQETQRALRDCMQVWQSRYSSDTREKQRRFFTTFNIDVLSAQALGTKDAEVLNGRITIEIKRIDHDANGMGDQMGCG